MYGLDFIGDIMKVPQFKDHKGNWIAIPTVGMPNDPIKIAYEYCRNNKLHTRVIETYTSPDGKEIQKVIREFRIQTTSR